MDAPKADAGPFAYKFHQIAMYVYDIEKAVAAMTALGYTEWSYDTAMLIGQQNGHASIKRGFMAFNYQMTPMELEFVCYENADGSTRRHDDDPRDGTEPFISHMSVHVEDLDAEVESLASHGWHPYHRFTTSQHTNPAVAGKKRFKEAIYDTRHLFGFDVKLIQRVMEG